MLVWGMDPGSLCFGVGIVEKEKRMIRYRHSLALKLKGDSLQQRMELLWDELGRLLQSFPPAEAAMEEGYLGKNVHSLSVLSTVRGVVMAALIARGCRLHTYSPRQVKMALTGYGQADKSQVARMVGMLLQMPNKSWASDESDALAVAYCHALSLP